MAFSKLNLLNASPHENNDFMKIWIYQEDATLAAITASGYFNDATDDLKKGDVIIVHANNGTQYRQVTSATGAATVTVGALS